MNKIKSTRGRMAYEAGRAAEMQVAAVYRKRGAVQIGDRWRGKAGEIDLIFRDGPTVVFVEVKSSKTHDLAAKALSARQQHRILSAGEEFCGQLDTGSATQMRFDVALIGGSGQIEILEAAIGV